MNPDTTIVRGIKCKDCGNELPPMTMSDHLAGHFNKECPHTPHPEGTCVCCGDPVEEEPDDDAVDLECVINNFTFNVCDTIDEVIKEPANRRFLQFLGDDCGLANIELPSEWAMPFTRHRMLHVIGDTNYRLIERILTFYKHKTFRRKIGDHRFFEGFVKQGSDALPRRLHLGS
jgi:hypothetical protein